MKIIFRETLFSHGPQDFSEMNDGAMWRDCALLIPSDVVRHYLKISDNVGAIFSSPAHGHYVSSLALYTQHGTLITSRTRALYIYVRYTLQTHNEQGFGHRVPVAVDILM